ncbi:MULTISPECIES: recombinase family protein [Burkholderia]|uniref:recombinase family protein n=1 Tax=Burkholderia TaxID=32008 RepID=UPI00075A6D8E|nr:MULTISPECIES: recombinase family protein [Burkholderia]KVM72778.1 hypothetical protein WJ59_04610 [Burkholderia gladioli]NBI46195.1 recombinase family protein [Burkholderia sp. ISTR5]NIF74297.1 recombinase family protein [Burkholderia sp. Ap-962]NIF88171.1 recombinase family protein [Burkholderia sp. Cy-637]NRF84680.1 recombinase family protein [Burkholderia gladioli]
MLIGYARVSTEEQHLGLQVDALRKAGCHEIFMDQGISGAKFSRPGLETALGNLAPGDCLMVWRLDRLGRSLGKLIDLVADLEQRGIQFESLTESINTKSSSGLLVFHMMAALAQFERNLISERTRAGMAAARARGSLLGRKPALDSAQRRLALELLQEKSVAEVASLFDVHPRTVKRIMKA